MAYYIIIRGPLGSGKTTIAKKLADKLHAARIDMDEILEKNGLDQAVPDGYVPTENFIRAINLIIPDVEKYLREDKVVIFDGCFYYKEALEHLIKKLLYKNHIFTLKVSVEACIKRDANRDKSLGKDAVEVIHNIVSSFDYGINIDTSGTLDATMDKILSYIN